MVDERLGGRTSNDRDLRAKGIALAAFGSVIISPDSLIIRLLSLDTWTILAWRGALMAVGLLLIVAGRYGRDSWNRLRAVGQPGLLIVILAGTSNILFVTAITHTRVVNTLVIMAGAPIVAGLLGWALIGEKPMAKTWVAISLVICGVALIVEPNGSASLLGDLAAVGAMLGLASTLTVTRMSRANDMIPAMIGAQVLVALVAVPLAHFATTTVSDLVLLTLGGLLLLPIATALLISAPRYIPAAEVSLFLPLETVLGSMLVWLVLGEEPTARASIGAILILGTLVVHSYLDRRQHPWLRST